MNKVLVYYNWKLSYEISWIPDGILNVNKGGWMLTVCNSQIVLMPSVKSVVYYLVLISTYHGKSYNWAALPNDKTLL